MRETRVSKKDNLFASSRFVLPEHRELYARIKEEERRYVPPQLDQEQLGEMSERVWQAFQTGSGLTVTYYDGQQPRRLSAHVVHIDQEKRRIKLRAGTDIHWISFARLLQVELASLR
ncbi:YolD-like family protein [Brevibacillus choshinensis]|uniref:YolD-like family protein n=1 Tax=Brevibacillus choshinensis TaxID=54911 RepID=UPI002E240730|nr:YolD-like family protein [Brevibacillus choshinensis]MED4749899.1 YolD-like family protein [Brevibacillus choshinensis]MED4780566.1 YolD-like family protein [Brevibacillus choshinensis]